MGEITEVERNFFMSEENLAVALDSVILRNSELHLVNEISRYVNKREINYMEFDSYLDYYKNKLSQGADNFSAKRGAILEVMRHIYFVSTPDETVFYNQGSYWD